MVTWWGIPEFWHHHRKGHPSLELGIQVALGGKPLRCQPYSTGLLTCAPADPMQAESEFSTEALHWQCVLVSFLALFFTLLSC